MRKPTVFFLFLTVLWTAGAAPDAQGQGGTGAEERFVQKTCPVMEGKAVNPNVFTVYKGKKVYFCCTGCREEFEANPGKYLARLPQFADLQGGPVRKGRPGFHPGQLVEPFGLATLSLLSVTFCFGLFMRKKPKVLLNWHRRLAYVTIIVALSHATLVFIAHNL